MKVYQILIIINMIALFIPGTAKIPETEFSVSPNKDRIQSFKFQPPNILYTLTGNLRRFGLHNKISRIDITKKGQEPEGFNISVYENGKPTVDLTSTGMTPEFLRELIEPGPFSGKFNVFGFQFEGTGSDMRPVFTQKIDRVKFDGEKDPGQSSVTFHNNGIFFTCPSSNGKTKTTNEAHKRYALVDGLPSCPQYLYSDIKSIFNIRKPYEIHIFLKGSSEVIYF
jgi:hypothetical protein